MSPAYGGPEDQFVVMEVSCNYGTGRYIISTSYKSKRLHIYMQIDGRQGGMDGLLAPPVASGNYTSKLTHIDLE